MTMQFRCQPAVLQKRKDKQPFAGNPRVSLWEPPQSPYGLIEEQLFGNPWKLLVACILLNKTSVVQVALPVCVILANITDAVSSFLM